MQLRDMLRNAERLVSNKSVFEERVAATMGSSPNGGLPRTSPRHSFGHASVAHGSWWQADKGVMQQTHADGERVRKLNGMCVYALLGEV